MTDEWGALEHYLRAKTRSHLDVEWDSVVAPVAVVPGPAVPAPIEDVPA